MGRHNEEMWPDGKTEKRRYFTKNQEQHISLPLREEICFIAHETGPHSHKTESTGNLYSTKKILLIVWRF